MSTDEDATNGLTDADAARQTKLRNDFANFLTCVATYCPTGFMDTILREFTSFKGIIQKIISSYDLDCKGEKFLSIMDIKFEFDQSFTYEQGYMKIKDFCMQSLLPQGATFKSRQLQQAESLSPLAENFIMKEFLQKVHPKLPDHIRSTKGHLFTADRPTLACNKSILIDMMDSMLAELEALENQTINRVSVANIAQSRPFRPHRGNYSMRQHIKPFNNRGRSNFRSPRPSFTLRNQAPFRKEHCTYCIEAKMYDASKCHSFSTCPFRLGHETPYQEVPRPNNMRVLLLQEPSDQNNHQYDVMQNQAWPQQLTYEDFTPYEDQDMWHQEGFSYDLQMVNDDQPEMTNQQL